MRAKGLGALSHVFEIVQRERVANLESEVQALKAGKPRAGQAEEKLLTTKEIAALGVLGVTHFKTVEEWARDPEKDLPCVRIGRNVRFRLGDVLRWRAQRMGG